MTTQKRLETDRIILRQWQESDKEPFAKLNSDPETLKFFSKLMTKDESDGLVDRISDFIAEKGYGLFAMELKETNEFIGFTGLAEPSWEAMFTPCTEIGWRMDKKFWGNGYATEAAKSVLDFAFNEIKLKEVVSFTSPFNKPSINVMKKIGMVHDPSRDFEHPRIQEGHELRQHVFYCIKNPY